MAGYGSKQVSVGSALDATAGVTRSLNNISNTLGQQVAAKDARKAREVAALESQRRFDIQQGNIAKTERQKLLERTAKTDINRWQSNINPATQKYGRSAYTQSQLEAFDYAKKSHEDDRLATEKFFSSEGKVEDLNLATERLFKSLDPTKLQHKGLVGKPAVAAVMEQRKARLFGLQAQLDDIADPTAKAAKLKSVMDEMYNPHINAINDEIASGSTLVNKQKLAAIMRTAPESFMEYGNFSQTANSIRGLIGGNTENSLRVDERSSNAALNKDKLTRYNAAVKQNKAYNASKKSSKTSGMAKLFSILGFSGDNEFDRSGKVNVKQFVTDGMENTKINENDMAMAITFGKDSTWFGFGDGKTFPEKGSDEYTKLVMMAEDFSKDRDKDNEYKPLGELKAPTLDRTVEQIQVDMLKGRMHIPRGVLNVGREYLKSKGVVTPERVVTEQAPVTETLPKPIIDETITGPALTAAVDNGTVTGLTNNQRQEYNSISTPKGSLEDKIRNSLTSDTLGGAADVKISALGNPLPPGFKLNTLQQAGVDFADAAVNSTLYAPRSLLNIGKKVYNDFGRMFNENSKSRSKSRAALQKRIRSNPENYGSVRELSGSALHGNDAVKAVESIEGSLSNLERRVVMDEGYSKEVYKDTKGIPTRGVGQTGKFMDGSAKEAIGRKISKSKELVPKFDSFPEDVQYGILQAVYRGDAKKSHKWIKHINNGDYRAASAEILNHDEYKALKAKGTDNSITRRLEEASRAFLAYGLTSKR